MEGMQKRKACSEPAPAPCKWDEELTYCGDGRYVMLPWKPCPQFRKSSSAYAQDPQPLMRMSIGLSVTERIITALDALAHEMQPAKKTRSGAAFEAGKDDSKTVRHLRICGGWPDWLADYDHNGAARKDYSIKNALCLQQQLGAAIAIFSELESLTLQNM
jgi:hypothetical protein